MKIITCPECSSVYELSDELFQPGRSVRCSVCHHVWQLEEIKIPMFQQDLTKEELFKRLPLKPNQPQNVAPPILDEPIVMVKQQSALKRFLLGVLILGCVLNVIFWTLYFTDTHQPILNFFNKLIEQWH